MNDTLKLLKNRASLRRFSDKVITEEHLDYILEGAMRAPTAGNMMLYSIIVVEDKEKKEILSRTCDNQPFIANSPVLLIFVADFQKWEDYYSTNKVDEYCKENNIEYTRPSEASLFLGIGDALIAAQNAVVAAESLGIGSCYIGDIMEEYEMHKKLLNLPEFVFPAAMLCLGYYPENYNQKIRERFDKKYVVFKEEYQRLTVSDIEDMYKSLDSRFVEPNKFNAKNYGQMHYAFKTRADFSIEMARSIKEVLKIWNGKEYK